MNCLDSSFLIDFLDSEGTYHEDAVDWMEGHSETTLATPAICAFEVLRGSARSNNEQFDRTVGFLRTMTILDLTIDAAIAAGRFDGNRHAAGEPLSPLDTLIASAARENAATLVTRDADFENVSDVDVTIYTNS